MQEISPILSKIKKYSIAGATAWSLVILGSLYWNISDTNRQVFELAKQSAIDHFNKDHAARLWGTSHGGVYVTPDERTPPSPYMAHLPDRDIVTTTGKKVTLMNPAYMLRQMMNDYSKLYGIRGKITGLVVLNPINKPDQWEIDAIKSFQKGAEEAVAISEIDGEPYLRLMRPMWMTEGCTKCHGHLGFKDGDLRGGVGVSIPMAPFQEIFKNRIPVLVVLYSLIWLAGLTGIYFISSRSKLYAIEEKKSEDAIRALNADLEDRIKRRTRELQEKESRLSAIVNTSPEGIITVNEQGIIESVNPEMEKLFGYSTEELIGKNVKILVPPPYYFDHDDYIKDFLTTFKSELIGSGRQVFGQRKDGSQFPLYLAIRRTQVDSQHLFTGMMHDLTKEVAAENYLKQAKEKAEQANEAKTQFLANMSHELRTPLNAVLGFAQVLRRSSNLDENQQDAVNIIDRSGQHLLNLINDILDISKIEAGKAVLHTKNFDLLDMLQHISDLFSGYGADKELLFEMQTAKNIPQYIQGDEGKLRQILINLLGNAFKFTEQGKITLKIDATVIEKDTYQLHFGVKDTGMGIASEDLEKIFSPFTQTEEGASKPAGTGLGLSICRKFIRLMDGDIAVQSVIGQGSVFSFTMHAKKAEASNTPARPQQVTQLAPNQRSYRVLIVEDIKENRTLLVNLMEQTGFTVKEAVNGKEGVELFHSWQPDLIWMDLRMPVMDGYQAVQEIKKTEAGQNTVVIALSAHALEEEREKILSLGSDDFLSKPYVEEELFAAMKKHLGVHFIHKSQKPPSPAVSSSQSKPGPEKPLAELLTELPEKIKKDLLAAATVLDQAGCLTILEQFKAEVPTAVTAFNYLNRLAKNYQFEDIEQILNDIE
jgi:two-component system sensor histidine kinase/response regulator